MSRTLSSPIHPHNIAASDAIDKFVKNKLEEVDELNKMGIAFVRNAKTCLYMILHNGAIVCNSSTCVRSGCTYHHLQGDIKELLIGYGVLISMAPYSKLARTTTDELKDSYDELRRSHEELQHSHNKLCEDLREARKLIESCFLSIQSLQRSSALTSSGQFGFQTYQAPDSYGINHRQVAPRRFNPYRRESTRHTYNQPEASISQQLDDIRRQVNRDQFDLYGQLMTPNPHESFNSREPFDPYNLL